MAIVTVSGIPSWVDHKRMLDDEDWERSDAGFVGERSIHEAADIAERLRNLGMEGRAFEVGIDPAPRRSVVRQARLNAARRRRVRESGFNHPQARVDDEGRAFVTAERLALRLGSDAEARVVIDATAGCGGNAIGFARAGARVIAIDNSPERLALARHNAALYQVQGNIDFICGDARKLLPGLEADLVFLDPPWGEVDPVIGADIPLLDELIAASAHHERVWAKVPPSLARWNQAFRPTAWFGLSAGDYRRVKFLLLRR